MPALCSSLRNVLLCGALSLALTACEATRDQPPAPVTNLGTHVESQYGVILVQDRDTVWTVAQRYNLPVRDIIDLNGLQPPYRLSAGQRLKLPPPMEHRAGAHDTLSSLARMYNVSVSQLVKTNDLKKPYLLAIGQVVRIPSSLSRQDEAQAAVFSAPPVPAAVAPPVAAAPVFAETLPPPTPAAEPPAVVASASSAVPSALTAPIKEKNLPVPQTTVLDSRRPDFSWPLRGKIISAYGGKDDGLFNDGINIAAPKGTPVAAAADGIVAYVGNELGSYGNLVLIRHGGGMVTAYAHLSTITVRKDAPVRKGQAIGAIGSTGTVANTQLHFEIRQGTRTYDPQRFLRG
jgi:murein DD-endopeptidase MepM/ murein hydrolase activator NlpD